MVPKILVADDSAVAATMASNALRKHGYEVVRASNGIEAVQRAHIEMPDLVLLDIFMPLMNGYQACRLLKDDPATAHIPIVILTGSDSQSAEFWSRQTGADAFMTKGFDFDALLEIISKLLALRTTIVAAQPGKAPGPDEILSRLSVLMDRELYASTIERTELQTVLQNLGDGILTLKMDGTVIRANLALAQMLGVSEAELLGHSCQEALGELAGAATMQLFEAALGERAAPLEPPVTRADDDHELFHRNGSATPVSVKVALLYDYLGETVGCVCVYQDITRRKEMQSLYEKLKELDKAKEDLTHMIVHDLRTPLTSVIAGMQTLELVGELNEDQQEMTLISISGGESLLGMINNLLDISKLEAGSLTLEYSELTAERLVGKAIGQVRPLAAAKNLEIVCQVDGGMPSFSGDEDKLCRTLVNLIGNAIKFTPGGGTITVSATYRGDTAELEFAVHDTGEGIPPHAFQKIFEKFGQVESRQGGRKMSTGLGLTFSKMAVETHGGRIWVQSNLAEGSTFSFTVPRKIARPLTAFQAS